MIFKHFIERLWKSDILQNSFSDRQKVFLNQRQSCDNLNNDNAF